MMISITFNKLSVVPSKKFFTVSPFSFAADTPKPNKLANMISGSKCFLDNKSGKSETVKVSTIFSLMSTVSTSTDSFGMVFSILGLAILNVPSMKIELIRLVVKKIIKVVFMIRPNFFPLPNFASELDIRKNTSGTTMVNNKFMKMSPSGLIILTCSFQKTPSNAPSIMDAINT